MRILTSCVHQPNSDGNTPVVCCVYVQQSTPCERRGPAWPRAGRVHDEGVCAHVCVLSLCDTPSRAATVVQELRELTRLESARFVVDEAELDAGFTEASQEEIKQHRAKKRMNELLRT